MSNLGGHALLQHIRNTGPIIAGPPTASLRFGGFEARWQLQRHDGRPLEPATFLVMKTVPRAPDRAHYLMYSPDVSDQRDRNVARLCVNADHYEKSTSEKWVGLIHHHEAKPGGGKRNRISDYDPNPASVTDHVSREAYYLEFLAHFCRHHGIDPSGVDLDMERW